MIRWLIMMLVLLRKPHYVPLFFRFKHFTMIPGISYLVNLELADKCKNIRGAIVECGTWKGGMIAGIASCLGPDREYYLFDSFEGLPKAREIDGISAIEWQNDKESPDYHDNCAATEADARKAMSLAHAPNTHIIKGWFENTLPGSKFPGGIALLRMDGDWYDSTIQILTNLFPLVNADGLIIIDDYYAWDGCSRAVHDYLSREKRPEKISCRRGICFIRKRAD
jgi:O-methyltransferase